MKQKPLFVQLPDAQHRAIKAAAAEQGVTLQKLVQSTLAASFAFQTPNGNGSGANGLP